MTRTQMAADLLIEARREGRRIERLPEHCRPLDDAAGYAIQEYTATRLGVIGGYKIGADNAAATPLYAPIFARDIFASGVALPASAYSGALLEAELAFRVQRDLPMHGAACSYDIVAASVELLPALEIYNSRYQNAADTSGPEQLADCLANRGLIHGEPSAAALPLSSSTWTIELDIDGKVARVRDARHPVGDPLILVVWLANHLARKGEGLRAGQIVTTGALALGPAGARVSAQWQGLGSVSASFEGAAS